MWAKLDMRILQRLALKNPRLQIIWLSRRTFGWLTGYFDRKKQNCGQSRSSTHKASSVRTVFGRCDVCRLRPITVLFTEIMLLCWYDNSQGVFKSFSKWYSSIGKKLCPTTDMISSDMGQFCGTLSDYLQRLKMGVSQNLYELYIFHVYWRCMGIKVAPWLTQ